MTIVGRDLPRRDRLARIDALIAEGKARAARYRDDRARIDERLAERLEHEHDRSERVRLKERDRLKLEYDRARAQKDPPPHPPHPAPPPPSPPPTPGFPDSLAAATARFIVAAARRARGVDPGDDQPGNHGDDGDRDKSPKEPPELGSLILDAIRRRGK
jgi:hypothetical protein